MWNLILAYLIPLAIKFGVEWVLSKFPGLPEWVKEILKKLSDDKAVAASIENPAERKAAVYVAKCKARNAVREKVKRK